MLGMRYDYECLSPECCVWDYNGIHWDKYNEPLIKEMKMAGQEVRINVRVSPEFKEKVNEYISENNLSLTDIVIKGVESFMNPSGKEEAAKTTETLEILVKSLAMNVQSLSTQVQTLQEKLIA